MISTLIYCSKIEGHLDRLDLERLVQAACEKNKRFSVTGILLFDGTYFVQLLEGPRTALKLLFAAISHDPRHRNVVTVLRDLGDIGRFKREHMAFIDLRTVERSHVRGCIQAAISEHQGCAESDDRVIRLLMWYALEGGVAQTIVGDPVSRWRMGEPVGARTDIVCHGKQEAYRFALQPIVSPAGQTVTSYEFLIRDATGGSPQQLFAALSPQQLYEMDVQSKALAFRMAAQMGLSHSLISVNLLPMALLSIPDAVDRLLASIIDSGLSPRQIIVEITEQEAVANLQAFGILIDRLRRNGIGLAIDDFGAGFAGLSLLAEFQPDKLKIDRALIQNIHQDGPRQAIVRAIVQASVAMGITVIAEGVEQLEEWCWLSAAGITRFQGFLFAKPAIDAVPGVQWPQPVI